MYSLISVIVLLFLGRIAQMVPFKDEMKITHVPVVVAVSYAILFNGSLNGFFLVKLLQL